MEDFEMIISSEELEKNRERSLRKQAIQLKQKEDDIKDMQFAIVYIVLGIIILITLTMTIIKMNNDSYDKAVERCSAINQEVSKAYTSTGDVYYVCK